MLEGLEITEVSISALERTHRLDSEFYSRSNLKQVALLENIKAISLCHFADISDGNHMSISKEFVETGIPYYRGGDIYNSFIEFATNPLYIPQRVFDIPTMHRSHLHKGDILMSIVGAIIGNISIVATNNDATCSCKLAIIRPKENVSSEYLATYLRSRFGQQQIQKFRRGSGQTGLILEDFDQLLVPYLENSTVQLITDNVNKSLDCSLHSQQLYASAESYLLDCLGMANFAANPDAYNIKTLKESFLETGRFDSEYYLPKYEDYIELVHSYPNGYDLIGNVCDIKDNNYTPVNGIQYKYIELANIGKSGEITGCNEQAGEELPTRARRIVHKGDVIVSSIEGSLDSCALVTDEYDRALCSTGFYVLKSHQHNPETLLTLFKSLLIQNLMKKGCSGTILTAIGKSEFEKIPIPLIRQEVQDEIAKHVKKSFELRMEAMQLLENAKLTVENIIETGGGNLLIYNELQLRAFEEWNQAVWLLFTEIGITSNIDVKAPIGSTYKKLSNSFLKSGRLDAEYYQPKYDHLFSELKRFKTKTIRQIATLSKSIEPGSDAYCEKGIPFIRVADLSKFGLSEPAVYLNKLEFKDTIRPQKDTILLSKDGSVGIAYKMEEPIDVITSGAIIHLNITDKDVLPDYLTLVLNSSVVKLQAERDAGGSIIQHWKPSEIEDVIIPILPTSEQVTISKMLQQSFTLRKESKRLLQEAIQIVETAIEEN
ncbi:restriction endonuclease subunit S [Parabacteroides merdae]|nr:restriction endonuclease subunit S [Parabacteroides merdae]